MESLQLMILEVFSKSSHQLTTIPTHWIPKVRKHLQDHRTTASPLTEQVLKATRCTSWRWWSLPRDIPFPIHIPVHFLEECPGNRETQNKPKQFNCTPPPPTVSGESSSYFTILLNPKLNCVELRMFINFSPRNPLHSKPRRTQHPYCSQKTE